jgi:hypothetical protein
MVKEEMRLLDESIKAFFGNKRPALEVEKNFDKLHPKTLTDKFLLVQDDEDTKENDATIPEANNFTPDSYNKYLTAEVLLPNGGKLVRAKVTSHKRDADGKPIGKSHSNPLLDRWFDGLFHSKHHCQVHVFTDQQ